MLSVAKYLIRSFAHIVRCFAMLSMTGVELMGLSSYKNRSLPLPVLINTIFMARDGNRSD